MKMHSFLFTLLFLGGSLCAAESQTLFFAKETAKDSTRIVLTLEAGKVNGTQVWQPKEDAHGARGSLTGTMTEDGLIRALYEYTIEGSEQTEEQIFKLDGDKLFPGEGELTEGKGGLLRLKEPGKVAFPKEKMLTKINVTEPKAGTPERKAIMDAMRGPMTERIGKAVTFTGEVRVSGPWARFQGNVKTTDGKAPKNDEAAGDLELDFFALLKKDKDGEWQVVHSGFAGDIGVREEAREKFPKAPWVLFE